VRQLLRNVSNIYEFQASTFKRQPKHEATQTSTFPMGWSTASTFYNMMILSRLSIGFREWEQNHPW
jgi:hypothetical protein